MSRSVKKHSSGFHEMGMRRVGDESSDEDEFLVEDLDDNGYQEQISTHEDAPITIEDSDDDNNNEEHSPDRHRTAYHNRDSEETLKGRDSDSSDSVEFVEQVCPPDDEGMEELSKITSNIQLNERDKVCANDFNFLKLLGTGAYGRVYLVKKNRGKDKGTLYAMKVLEKTKVTNKKKTTEHTRTEREVLEKVTDHPFLASMRYAFQTPEKLYLVLDFYQGGELFTHLYKSEHFSEDQVRKYIAEIIVALEQLHNISVIYRDIKLENILLDAQGHIILTDFGLSKELRDGARAHSFCGTIEYMAPEIVSQQPNGHDLNVDWWSVGVLMIELLSGQSPFSKENEENLQQIISERIQKEEPTIPPSINDTAKDLILKLLEKDPRKRLGYRNDAEDLKSHKFFNGINWEKLKRKEYEAPIKPNLKGKEDVSQFSEDFTNQNAIDLPCHPPAHRNAANFFKGYSYVDPKFRTKVADVEPVVSVSTRPDIATVLKYQKQGKSSFFRKYQIKNSEPIGDGSYSICVRCMLRKSGKEFAVKIMNISHNASNEVEALKKCQGNENIVKLVEYIEDVNFKFIVFELLSGGELFNRIRMHGHFSEALAQSTFKQILEGVRYIHDQGFVHRDLKPENIMFVNNDEDSHLRILDFGFARHQTSEEIAVCYTLDYAAPESLAKSPTNFSRDTWSLGTILYTMLCGNTPFMPNNINKQLEDARYRHQLTENIKRGLFNQNCEPWKVLSENARDLITELLNVDEKQRITLDEVFEHPWVHQVKRHEKRFDIVVVNPMVNPDETITIDDDSMDVPPAKEVREDVSSNDSSGIELSDRNEGSSLSSHTPEINQANHEEEEEIHQANDHEVVEDEEQFSVIEPEPEPQIPPMKIPKKRKHDLVSFTDQEDRQPIIANHSDVSQSLARSVSEEDCLGFLEHDQEHDRQLIDKLRIHRKKLRAAAKYTSSTRSSLRERKPDFSYKLTRSRKRRTPMVNVEFQEEELNLELQEEEQNNSYFIVQEISTDSQVPSSPIIVHPPGIEALSHAAEVVQEQTITKRPRGRPKGFKVEKVVPKAVIETNENVDTNKKRRGRPPSNKVQSEPKQKVGRGRKRKVDELETSETAVTGPLPKKQRGRPKKVQDPESQEKPPKTPRKLRRLEVLVKPEPVEKHDVVITFLQPKGRGRKPKHAIDQQLQREYSTLSPKRRGRKPKQAIEQQSLPVDAVQAPKRRGRKPKQAIDQQVRQVESIGTPKRRGRKPKQASDQQSAPVSSTQTSKRRGRKPNQPKEEPIGFAPVVIYTRIPSFMSSSNQNRMSLIQVRKSYLPDIQTLPSNNQ